MKKQRLPCTTARNKIVWHLTRASRGAIVSMCCVAGSAHHQGTFSQPSTCDILALEKFQDFRAFRILDKGC
jgi:hypothetical protein